jgi:hypothetical protein
LPKARKLLGLVDASAGICTDGRVCALSHPERSAFMHVTGREFLELFVAAPENRAWLFGRVDEGMRGPAILQELYDMGDRYIDRFLGVTMGAGYVAGCGTSNANIQYLRFGRRGGRVFKLSSGLTKRLDMSDLSGELDVGALALPDGQRDAYIDFGLARTDMTHALWHSESGMHAFEGAYISMVDEGIEITMTGSAFGRKEASDDAVEWLFLRTTGGGSLNDALRNAYSKSGVDLGTISRLLAAQMGRLELVAKALVLLRTEGVGFEFRGDGAAAKAAVLRARSGAHKRRALRDSIGAIDHWRVTVQEAGGDEPRGVKAHLRRGHFRNQRHGPGLSLVKVIWLQPCWVGAESLAA